MQDIIVDNERELLQLADAVRLFKRAPLARVILEIITRENVVPYEQLPRLVGVATREAFDQITDELIKLGLVSSYDGAYVITSHTAKLKILGSIA